MRTLAVTQHTTLAGAVEMLGDWFDPGDQDEELAAALRRLGDRGDALLLGRRTFEDFRSYWPKQTDDRTGVAATLDRVRKYVVSSTLNDPDWQNSTILSDRWLDRVRELKEQPGGDIGVTGSIQLCHTLIEAELVDEYRLFVHPAVQGRGRRLFPDGFAVPRLETVESTTFGNGITLLRYAVRRGGAGAG